MSTIPSNFAAKLRGRPIARTSLCLGSAIGFVLVPKCPLCLATYAATLGFAGFSISSLSIFAPTMFGLLFLTTVLWLWWTKGRGPIWPLLGLLLSGIGLLLVPPAWRIGLALASAGFFLGHWLSRKPSLPTSSASPVQNPSNTCSCCWIASTKSSSS